MSARDIVRVRDAVQGAIDDALDLPLSEINWLAWSCVVERPSTLTVEDVITGPVNFDACDSQKLAELLRDSKSVPPAYDACVLLAERIIENGTALPPPLSAFVVGVLRGERSRPKRRGRSRYINLLRDFMVRLAVNQAITAGLNPYRNEASAPVSACDVVAECMQNNGINLTYQAVTKIWENRDSSP